MTTTSNPQPLRLSVVIPVHNGQATLARCLTAIYQSETTPSEVIVVDDASRDGTVEIAARFPCKLVRLERNVGAARAKNRGAEAASGDALFFTDADVLIPPQALTWVTEDYAAADQPSGVVGLLGPELPFTDFPSQFKNLWMHFTYARLPRYVGLFYTSAASLRRELFLAQGGFDESYLGASVTEDMDFGQRLLTAGYRLLLDKRLMVQHLKRYTFGELLRTDLERSSALTKILLRNWLAGAKRKHYASVPWFFTASVPISALLGLGLLLLPFQSGIGGALALGSLALIWLLNASFLACLGKLRGGWFLAQAMLFLPLNLFVSGLGIVAALWDLARGRRY